METIRLASYEEKNEELRHQWLDQFVEVSSERVELKRFAGIVGRVITINMNNRAIVDFQDGGWYDIATDFLTRLDPAQAKGKYDPKTNSAQPIPDKQG